MGGEIINCLLMSFTLISSSKVILISFPSKLVLKFLGRLFIILGAIVSLSPPEIVVLLAQFINNKLASKIDMFLKFVIVSNNCKPQNNNYI